MRELILQISAQEEKICDAVRAIIQNSRTKEGSDLLERLGYSSDAELMAKKPAKGSAQIYLDQYK